MNAGLAPRSRAAAQVETAAHPGQWAWQAQVSSTARARGGAPGPAPPTPTPALVPRWPQRPPHPSKAQLPEVGGGGETALGWEWKSQRKAEPSSRERPWLATAGGLQDPQAPGGVRLGCGFAPSPAQSLRSSGTNRYSEVFTAWFIMSPVSAHDDEVQRGSQGLFGAQVDASGPPRLRFSERK